MDDGAGGSWLRTTERSPEQLLDLRPDLAFFYERFDQQIWAEGVLDPVLLELCRLRMAQLLGDGEQLRRRSEPAVRAGLTEEKIAALPSWSTDDAYGEAERAALAVAELFVIDPHAVTDDQMASLCQFLDPPAVVALMTAFALFDGFGRFRGSMARIEIGA